MTNTLKEKILLPLIVTGVLGIIGTSGYLSNKAVERNGGKIMPRIQPWIWVYDDNRDGTPDRTVVGYRALQGGVVPVLNERKPTQGEIEWYISQNKKEGAQ